MNTNPAWVAAPYEVSYLFFGKPKPEGLSRKRWRHISRQRARRIHASMVPRVFEKFCLTNYASERTV